MTKIVDLFAGCGGLSQGAQQAGLTVIAAFDNWKSALDVYAANFNHPVFERDLSDVAEVSKELKSLIPNGIVGGPPCQDFSAANFSKKSKNSRSLLTVDFARIVDTVSPEFFVLENVPGALKAPSYIKARALLGTKYGLTECVLDASKFGVPQRRKRLFLVGVLNAEDGFLDLSPSPSAEEVCVKDYFESLGEPPVPTHFYLHPRTYGRRAIFPSNEPSPTIRGVNRPLPPTYKIHKKDSEVNLGTVRNLSTRERSIIQTFPPTFKWGSCGTKGALEQMIGNAVPPKLAAFVLSRLLGYLKPG